jgi:hypothetical protein
LHVSAVHPLVADPIYTDPVLPQESPSLNIQSETVAVIFLQVIVPQEFWPLQTGGAVSTALTCYISIPNIKIVLIFYLLMSRKTLKMIQGEVFLRGSTLFLFISGKICFSLTSGMILK